MSGARDTRLWCVHHIGPDDLYPAPDFETAQQWADYANAHINKGYEGISRHVVAVWPWAPEGHAEGLEKSIADWTLPTDPLVGELVERLSFWANRSTIDEIMSGKDRDAEWQNAPPERRIEIMGENKRRHDEEVIAARALIARARKSGGEAS